MYREWVIFGRRIPDDKDPNPKVYRMTIFAKDRVIARNRFWYYISRMRKVKRTHGEILALHEVREKKGQSVKNYGILARYNSALSTHNIYKEYRDTTRCEAVQHMFNDVASKYRVKPWDIQVLEIKVLKPTEVRRKSTQQFMNPSKLKFPLPHRLVRPSHKRWRVTFALERPHTVW
ncbi:60S ribosomal protein L20 [Pelomyxa schiedti]|nr:60S ribosomal protein L20 [Pelomyxa schiedti]